ncbi:MAG: allantoinase AllB [Bacteroidota bacterium]
MKAFCSKRVLLPGGICEAVVLVQNGVITQVTMGNSRPPGVHCIELGNQLLMPGVVDTHVHINEPGRTEWEGFDTITRAAIAGGVTTLVDMPLNASPVTVTANYFNEKLAAAHGQLHCNVGFWGGIVPGNTADIAPLIQKGVLGFKAFLTHSGIDDFPNVTGDDLKLAMPILAKHQMPLLVHCELTDNQTRATGNPLQYQNYLNSRPKKWEDDAIALMIQLCQAYHCRVHIVHLSSAESLEQIILAKSRGLPLTVETAQHYLYFCAEDIKDGQTQFKCAPPIRESANNKQLWLALKEGLIDMVATDHSPATPALKQTESGNFMQAWGGIASIQYALPVLWTAARERGCSMQQVAQWLCQKPALLAGLHHKKGSIAAGFDADLVVLDDEKSFVVEDASCLHRHKLSPYNGERLYGVVQQTYLAGQLVYEEGSVLALNKGKIILST